MPTDTREPIRLIQSGLDKLGHSPGAIDGLWGLRTARAMKALLAANGRAASTVPPGPLPWITEAKSALGRHEARDRSRLMDWLKRDGRSLGDLSKNPWCGDFVETCIRVGLPDEPLLGALGVNPY
jgi:peptidoglycan hydrolase-like protein with peptidoglycan-binding domain